MSSPRQSVQRKKRRELRVESLEASKFEEQREQRKALVDAWGGQTGRRKIRKLKKDSSRQFASALSFPS